MCLSQELQTLVARAVVNVQAEVMQRHGYAGDAGYAQAQVRRSLDRLHSVLVFSTWPSDELHLPPQVCLMEHANDAVVTAAVAAATTALYARAGINLHESLRQVVGQ